MDILQVLCILQLVALPAFTLTQPSHDYWGEYGAFGACSRTCGTGISMRTRRCITSRTDGGHNCIGSSKSFRTCNTQECPIGARDFREEQCSQFDRIDFQGKRFSWVPYYGASNPCELNCVPRGETFFYRHRPAVVDGTACYVGRRDICVDGVCRQLVHAEFPGLDENTHPAHLPAPAALAPPPRETHAHAYTVGMYGACSAPCNGGMQYRSVDCVLQDPVSPRVVDESYCISQHLQRPASQQACNMQPCVPEYTASSFSECSATCGEGRQTREVFCVGARGERLDEEACRGLVRPASVQACRKPACHLHITWHVTAYGLCTRSCGGGVRERRVACLDRDLNPYGEERCGSQGRPVTVETCNTQLCPSAQLVPSVQDPRAHDRIIRFEPHVPGEHSVPESRPNIAYDPYPSVIGPHCAQSYYGCCPDGHTSARGPRNEGCPQDDCVRTRYGCCMDGVTPAQGFGRAGCSDYHVTQESPSPPARPSTRGVCSLPRDDGPCDTWKVRFHYDSATRKCTNFWYGGCQGNGNNFASLEACQRECVGAVRQAPRTTPPRGSARRTPARRAMRARA